MCLHMLLFPFTLWWKGTQGCYKSLLRSTLWHSHAFFTLTPLLNSYYHTFFGPYFQQPCSQASFLPSHRFCRNGRKWLKSDYWQVRWAEWLILFTLNNRRVRQHFHIFRVTGRVIIRWECSWYSGQTSKNVKTLAWPLEECGTNSHIS